MRDIDTIAHILRERHPALDVRQLSVSHPGADDDGLWFFTHPGASHDVQLESTDGNCPFLFETGAGDDAAHAPTCEDATRLVARALGLDL